MDLWRLLGDLHPKLVHFPLVLLLAGLVFDAAGLVARSERSHFAARWLTGFGTFTLLVSFICGIYAEIWAGRALVPHYAIELHEWAANVASWGFVVLAAWRLLLDPAKARGAAALYVIVGLSWYALLVITAWLGGSLVADYGAAVTGARTPLAPSLHDLNTLAARQTDLNLRYSEMMHHIFGYLTLALSGSLLAAAVFPRHADRLKWVGPTLLLLGGVFLFFFADLDLYRFTDPRQWRDREVQLHKTIALALVVVGALGLRAARRRAELGHADPAPGKPSRAWARHQAKLIAVMALIGGGMLFTHVHTVAPYANVAAGVYVAHVTMGLVALAVGASALLGDAFPRRRPAFAVVFAACMVAESVLLITYNEGLPWYIGYGAYNRWGPHGGTVAPFGGVRAELCFDEAAQALDLYVLDRSADRPVGIEARSLDLVIACGYEETAVRLTPEGPGPSDRFVAAAPFLRGMPAFSARVALPVGRGGRWKTGYFDPWVTPLVTAVPPNEVASFVCPMHVGVRAASQGSCPLCGMPLVADDGRRRDALHDQGYEMALSVETSGSPRAVTLKLTPRKDGKTVTDLARVHERLLHLIIVSEDLVFFDHVHPEVHPDGHFAQGYEFPATGRYLLFTDVTPAGTRSQTFRLPVTIGEAGATRKPAALSVSPALSKPLATDPAVVVELVPTPRKLIAGTDAQLLFRLSEGGRPVSDLEPYLAAMGHCVVVSEDTNTYLHSHPEQLLAPRPEDRGGPAVSFHTRFPRPGRYKVWGQFRRGQRILVADFVVDVAAPPLPAGLMRFFLDE